MMRRLTTCALFAFTIILLSACGSSSAGTGLSQNQQHLSYFENNENITGLVIMGEYYLLPAPLRNFVENGWLPTAESLEWQFIADFNALYLPPLTSISFELSNNATNMEMSMNVENLNAYEEVHILDATVTRMDIGPVAKDQVVAVGGITGHTSRQDALAVAETVDNFARDNSRGNGFVRISQGTFDETNLDNIVFENNALRITFDGGVAVAFEATFSRSGTETTHHRIDDDEAERIREERREDERIEREEQRAEAAEAERQERIQSARTYEGIVIGIYYETPLAGLAVIAREGVVVIRDENNRYMAINSRVMMSRYEGIDIEPGDTVKVWSDQENDNILYEGHGIIIYITPGILLVNGQREYSLW